LQTLIFPNDPAFPPAGLVGWLAGEVVELLELVIGAAFTGTGKGKDMEWWRHVAPAGPGSSFTGN
jgi:hypothetical protein